MNTEKSQGSRFNILGLPNTWVKDSKGNLQYGLGLDYAEFAGKIPTPLRMT